MKIQKEKINALEKGLVILKAFTPNNEEMGTVEISEKLGFHPSTVSRAVHTLLRHDFLRQNPMTSKFMLGHASMNLGIAVQQALDTNIISIAKPHIDALRNRLEKTVVLVTPSGSDVILSYVAENLGPVRLVGTVGEIRPMHATAGGKAILAFSSPDLKETVLNKKLKRFTKNTIIEKEILIEQLINIKEQAFSFDDEEIHQGIKSIGVPVFNQQEIPLAAVVVTGLSHEISWDGDSVIVHLLMDTATTISTLLYSKIKLTKAILGEQKIDSFRY
jgi:DNA-binding IclR family transcriptional regulator